MKRDWLPTESLGLRKLIVLVSCYFPLLRSTLELTHDGRKIAVDITNSGRRYHLFFQCCHITLASRTTINLTLASDNLCVFLNLCRVRCIG